MNPPPLLEIEDLRISFGTRTNVVRAVDGVDLAIRPGEVLGLVGESGSG
jgi:ABC-type dipeptide/oligopeptide/nickel transport system ATPase component